MKLLDVAILIGLCVGSACVTVLVTLAIVTHIG
jgi:hypothetical protein